MAAVVVAGYHEQTVEGVRAPVYDLGQLGLCEHARRWEPHANSGEFGIMANAAEEITGLKIRTFQGCYGGTQFTVPHRYCPPE